MSTDSEPSGPTVRRTGSDSARRIIEILFAFTEDQPRRSARDLSEAVNIPIPSVHRYIALLRDLGLVTDGRRGLYQLTPRVFPLSRAAEAATSILDVARPHLSRLALELDETVALVQQIGDYPVCVARYESTRMLRASFQPGQAMPPLRGASAKLLLSGMPTEVREAYLRRMGQDPATASAMGWADEDLDIVRRQGWATSSHEINEGVWAVALAVEFNGRIVAAISIACPEFRMGTEQRETVIQRGLATAQAITRDLDQGVVFEA